MIRRNETNGVAELLADPIVRAMMRADAVDPEALERMLAGVRRSVTSRTASLVDAPKRPEPPAGLRPALFALVCRDACRPALDR